MSDARIAISRVHFPVTTLGPGKRLGVWLQGCSIRCAGCISADTWAAGRQPILLSELVAQIEPWLAVADGVTISGGEPFEQPDALRLLLRAVRERSGADVLVYSGYPFEAISTELERMQGLIDAVMTDPYRADAPQSLALRGSDNQRLVCLTPLGEERFGPLRAQEDSTRAFDVMFDEDGSVWLAGIPRREDWSALQDGLRARGLRFATSADASHVSGLEARE